MLKRLYLVDTPGWTLYQHYSFTVHQTTGRTSCFLQFQVFLQSLTYIKLPSISSTRQGNGWPQVPKCSTSTCFKIQSESVPKSIAHVGEFTSNSFLLGIILYIFFSIMLDLCHLCHVFPVLHTGGVIGCTNFRSPWDGRGKLAAEYWERKLDARLLKQTIDTESAGNQ